MRRSAPLWYEAAWALLLPPALLRIWGRGIREPGYRRHVAERFGRYAPLPDRSPVIWVHAVSVGETRAAQPLIAALRRNHPDHRIVLTVMTASGRATSEALYGDTVTRVWLPYDTGAFVERFLDWCRPRFGMLMETELWPNLVLRATARGIPMFLVNARMSEKSARGYRRFERVARDTLRALRGIAAQSDADADRLRALGALDVRVTGNVKFDVTVPEEAIAKGRALRALFGDQRSVWVAGSTRDGEETILLDALARHSLSASALLVIVPRHPQRFEEVVALVERRGLPVVRRSDNRPVPSDVTIVVGDSMGEMLAYYVAGDVAFIGGSLLPLGGQNLIEPLAVGTPVVIGPSSFNFSEVTKQAVVSGAAVQCVDADAVIASVATLIDRHSSRHAMLAAAAKLLDEHRGATARTIAYVRERLAPRDAADADVAGVADAG